MIQAVITTIKDNSVALPKTWKGAKVFFRVTGNTATITKVPSSKIIFTESEVKNLRKLGKKITKAALNKALKANR